MDLMSLTAVELGKKIQAKEVTVEEAVKAAIASIKAKEEKINSFVTIDEEGALKKAAEVQAKIDAGELKGALAGVPVAIKDNMCAEGFSPHVHRRYSTISFRPTQRRLLSALRMQLCHRGKNQHG